MDDITNPPTPPLDENSLNDLPGEPISPEVSDSDVYLNADDTFDQDHQTSSSSAFQNTDAIQKDENNLIQDMPSELDTEPTPLIAETNAESLLVEEGPSHTETIPVPATITDATSVEDITTNQDIRDNETVEEPDKKNVKEVELGEPSEDQSIIEREVKSINNDTMEVDNDDRQDGTEDVEMKDIEDEPHGDDQNLPTTKESHLKSDVIGDEPNDPVTDESKLESTDPKDEFNLEESLNQTSDQSTRNLDDSDSFQNDSTGHEKHHTEEVDMENLENVRDTTDKAAEDPFDTVRNNTSMDGMNNDLEKQDVDESQNKEHDETDAHNETEKDDGNESHDETTATGGGKFKYYVLFSSLLDFILFFIHLYVVNVYFGIFTFITSFCVIPACMY